MRCTLRIFSGILAVGSLLLCAASFAAWVRSHWVSDCFSWIAPDGRGMKSGVVDRGGLFWLTLRLGDGGQDDPYQGPSFEYQKGPPGGVPVSRWFDADAWHVAGFAYQPQKSTLIGHGWQAEVGAWRMPLWPVCLLTAAWSGLWLRGWLRRRRRGKAGTCLKCGYDLRATPQRCPECGTRVAEEIQSP